MTFQLNNMTLATFAASEVDALNILRCWYVTPVLRSQLNVSELLDAEEAGCDISLKCFAVAC